MSLSRLLGVPTVAIMDYDALMEKKLSITLNGRKLTTSSIVYSLWKMGNLNEGLCEKIISIDDPNSDWYDQSHLDDLRIQCMEKRIFVFSTDLEGVIQSQDTNKSRKPLKALERTIELISLDNIPSEFSEMCKFLSKYTSPNTGARIHEDI